MTVNCLTDLAPAFWSPHGRLDHHTLAEFRRPLFKDAWRGRSVALWGPSAFVAKWLALLDGVASALLLIPHDTALGLARDFAEKAGSEVLLSRSEDPGWSIRHAKDEGLELPLPALGMAAAVTPAEEPTRWLFTTSGTTSTPKIVEHTLKSLSSAVSRKARAGELKWGLLYDVCRFAGVQVLLQAWCNGAGLLIPEDPRDLTKAIPQLAEQGCSALSATPTVWRQILMSGQGLQLPLAQITLGGEIADAAVLGALRHAFPAAHITHVYASTEAGVGFAVHDGKAGFPASMLDGENLKTDAEGHLWIRKPGAARRYVSHEGALQNAEGWINSGDLIEVRDDRALFKGRANGAINVGGNKVYPEEVENLIRTVPGVRDAQVFGRQNPFTGQLVEALVVPEPNAGADLINAVKELCRANLAVYKVPARIKLVDQLNVSEGGKLLRRIG